jgi:hypothetical protein
MSIKDNTFAEACYNMNSIEELEDALKKAPDYIGMKVWNITEKEYFTQLQEALDAKKADQA